MRKTTYVEVGTTCGSHGQEWLEAGSNPGSDACALHGLLLLGGPGPPHFPPPRTHFTPRCVVCMEEARDTVFIPCGHFVVCSGCCEGIMNKSGECPVCRMPIKVRGSYRRGGGGRADAADKPGCHAWQHGVKRGRGERRSILGIWKVTIPSRLAWPLGTYVHMFPPCMASAPTLGQYALLLVLNPHHANSRFPLPRAKGALQSRVASSVFIIGTRMPSAFICFKHVAIV